MSAEALARILELTSRLSARVPGHLDIEFALARDGTAPGDAPRIAPGEAQQVASLAHRPGA